VIEQAEDIAEVRALCQTLAADAGRVILMPEGVDPDVIHQRSQWLVEICKQEGYRFSPRLHINIFGNRRGV
jgi:7-carboxy-7-deazaguanine synthase